MSGYEQLPGFEHLYLEDSWVLAVDEDNKGLRFLVEAVLTEEHPEWKPRKPNEQYSYRRIEIRFDDPDHLTFRRSDAPPAVDASGETDYGNIDTFVWEGGRYELEGSWGSATVEGAPPVVVDLGPG